MTILGDGQAVTVYSDWEKPLIRRDTNTVFVDLEQDEVLVLIKDLADKAYLSGIRMVIESDRIYAKDMD